MSKLKSPISWFGGKYYMANKIIELFPEHKMYIEVFGGSGQILFSKPHSDIEVYNDIDRNLVNFFRILRDKEKFEEFKLKLDLTPYSREEFYHCRDTWENETDEIEKVRKWYVTCMQSFSNNFSTWSHTKAKSRRGMSMAVSRYLGNAEENILAAVERLKTVQIENMDSLKLIAKYDNEDVLFYLDPPYIHETRKMTYQYAHEMINSQHEQLVDVLLKLKGKAILSGYDHEIYNRLIENGWRKVFLGDYVKRSVKTVGKEIDEKGAEFVWVNY